MTHVRGNKFVMQHRMHVALPRGRSITMTITTNFNHRSIAHQLAALGIQDVVEVLHFVITGTRDDELIERAVPLLINSLPSVGCCYQVKRARKQNVLLATYISCWKRRFKRRNWFSPCIYLLTRSAVLVRLAHTRSPSCSCIHRKHAGFTSCSICQYKLDGVYLQYSTRWISAIFEGLHDVTSDTVFMAYYHCFSYAVILFVSLSDQPTYANSFYVVRYTSIFPMMSSIVWSCHQAALPSLWPIWPNATWKVLEI